MKPHARSCAPIDGGQAEVGRSDARRRRGRRRRRPSSTRARPLRLDRVPAERQVGRQRERRLSRSAAHRRPAARRSGPPAPARATSHRPRGRTRTDTGAPSGTCTAISRGSCSRTTVHGGSVRRHGASRRSASDRSIESAVRTSTPSDVRTAVIVSTPTVTWLPRQSQKSVATPCAWASSVRDGVTAVREVVMIRAKSASPAGGSPRCHGAAASTWAATLSSAASPVGRPASIIPTGSPSAGPAERQRHGRLPGEVEQRGERGEPLVVLEVGGRVGQVSDRADRQRRLGEGGREQDVVRAVATITCRAITCSPITASANADPSTVRPRSRRWRVSGCRSASRAGSTGIRVDSAVHTVSNSATTHGGNGSSTSSTSWPSDSNSPLVSS